MARSPRVRGLLALPVIATLLGPLAACGDPAGTATPSVAEVAGGYTATTLVGKAPEGEFDALAAGGTLAVVLAADGTTTGRFFVPGGDEDGSDFEADLAGTWSLTGDRVTFDHAADTFLRDVVFTWAEGELRSDNAYARVVLTRTGAP